MKEVIRNGLFETNSSSVHSMIMCSKEEFDKLCNYELLIDDYEGQIVQIPDCELSDEDFEKAKLKYGNPWWGKTEWEDLSETQKKSWAIASKLGLDTYDTWGVEDYETFDRTYKTVNGDEVVAFGYYGWDN